MWEFLMGYFFARATGLSRYVRPMLMLVMVGVLIAGMIYAYVFVHAALEEGSHTPYVHQHESRH